MKIEGDSVVFSTGKAIYANRGILGIGSDLDVTYGYDGGFPAWPSGAWMDGAVLTEAERRELADYMIALWTEFRDATGPKESDDD